MHTSDILAHFGIKPAGNHPVHSPIDGAEIARVQFDDAASIETKIANAAAAFGEWRKVPAPRRGELVRLLGEELRQHKDMLGRLVTIECGKIHQEGLGEVQEMIDICDFAVGLSRQLYGLTIASERPAHRMMETWHPAGPVAVISAFNFPVAVWSWNAALALVCGDSVIWKPSEKTPLTALAVQNLFERALHRFGEAPAHLSQVVLGAREVGETLAKDARIPVVSATGSTRMGRELAPVVAARFGKTVLELGGNNAMIVAPSAKLDLAQRAITFSAVGTAGQRCTSLRRLFVHDSIYDTLVPALKNIYAGLPVGDPLKKGTLVGPLIDKQAFENMERALASAKDEGGKITGGGRVHEDAHPDAFYVQAGHRRDAGPDRDRLPRDLRADPLCHALFGFRRGHGPAQCGAAGPHLLHLHAGHAGSREVRLGRRIGLRHRQCEYRPLGRGNRRRLRRREGNRRRPRSRAPTPGRPICAARPRPSIIRMRCRWPRASSSTWCNGTRSGPGAIARHSPGRVNPS